MKTHVTLACVGLFAGSIVSQAQAQQSAPAASSIRVTGSAVVSVVADRAHIDVGVVTQSPQSQTAVSQNARKLDAVLTALRKNLGPSADIKTISYTLNPDYQYGGMVSSGPPTIKGYTATNVVRVTVDNLAKIGDVIDTASQAGANRIPSIQFALRDEQTVHSQAAREAALKARVEADALAAALGLKVSRILTVEETGPVGIPIREVMFAKAADASSSTPVQPGSLDVTATVVLTVEVNPGR